MPWSEEIYNIVNSLSELGWLYKRIKSCLDLFKKEKAANSQFTQSFIFAIQKEINAYEKYIINEMERINKAGGNDLIRYYRDVEKLSWNKISRLTNYSLRQCHRLYNK